MLLLKFYHYNQSYWSCLVFWCFISFTHQFLFISVQKERDTVAESRARVYCCAGDAGSARKHCVFKNLTNLTSLDLAACILFITLASGPLSSIWLTETHWGQSFSVSVMRLQRGLHFSYCFPRGDSSNIVFLTQTSDSSHPVEQGAVDLDTHIFLTQIYPKTELNIDAIPVKSASFFQKVIPSVAAGKNNLLVSSCNHSFWLKAFGSLCFGC